MVYNQLLHLVYDSNFETQNFLMTLTLVNKHSIYLQIRTRHHLGKLLNPRTDLGPQNFVELFQKNLERLITRIDTLKIFTNVIHEARAITPCRYLKTRYELLNPYCRKWNKYEKNQAY